MKNPYQRLPGRRWLSAGLIHRLWLGPDHLLAVAGSRYNETYQRFDFRDIQALISRRTRRRLAIGLALGIPAALVLALAAAAGEGALAASLVFSGPLLLGVAVNALRGPTCVAHLRTAVTVVELPSLARVRTFERAVRILRPRLEAAQGTLPREALEEQAAASAPVAPPARPVRPPRTLRPYRGVAHDVLFGLLIALGLVGLLRTRVSAPWTMGLAWALALAVFAALTVALVRQQETDLAAGVRRVVWAAIAYLGASVTVLYVSMVIQLVRNARPAQLDAEFRYIFGSAGSPAGLLVLALSLAGRGLGLAGELRLRAFRSSRRPGRRATPPPAQP